MQGKKFVSGDRRRRWSRRIGRAVDESGRGDVTGNPLGAVQRRAELRLARDGRDDWAAVLLFDADLLVRPHHKLLLLLLLLLLVVMILLLLLLLLLLRRLLSRVVEFDSYYKIFFFGLNTGHSTISSIKCMHCCCHNGLLIGYLYTCREKSVKICSKELWVPTCLSVFHRVSYGQIRKHVGRLSGFERGACGRVDPAVVGPV